MQPPLNLNPSTQNQAPKFWGLIRGFLGRKGLGTGHFQRPPPLETTQATLLTKGHLLPPYPRTTGFTWEQKQEQEIAWKNHDGRGLEKDFGPEKPEEQWGTER